MAGLAGLGGSTAWDETFDINNAVTTGTYANTTTAQYRVAWIQPSTTANDLAADFMVTSTMIPIGIIQDSLTNGSDKMVVRVGGISKAFAHDSIQAGAYVVAATQTAGDAECGYVTYFTPNTDFTSSVASKRILGIALTGAQKTGAALTILLQPHIGY